MTLATLTRVTEVPDDLRQLDADLAIKAQSELGYQPMLAHNQKRAAARYLFEQLIALGVPPFKPKVVVAYKRWQRAKLWLRAVVGQGIILFCYLTAIGMVARRFNPVNDLGGVLIFFVSLAGIITSVGLWIMLAPMAWRWRRASLSQTEEEVPADVLATALMIRHDFKRNSQVPNYGHTDVTFQVESLRYERMVMDPFLIVSYHGAEAYVAVWDEPTFKAK